MRKILRKVGLAGAENTKERPALEAMAGGAPLPLLNADGSAVAMRAPAAELGQTRFLRSLAEAKKLSKASGRPIALLFQELPGCSTCTNFGRDVLSDVVISDLIAERFVACAVNNRGESEEDKAALAAYHEPYLNNPVLRFVDASGRDLLPREAGVYDPASILRRMVAVLDGLKSGGPPLYAQLHLQSLELVEFGGAHAGAPPSPFERATFQCSCYWVGEAVLGSIDGVAATEPGWLSGSEVVRAAIDTRLTTLAKVARRVNELDGAMALVPHSPAQAEAVAAAGVDIPLRRKRAGASGGKPNVFSKVAESEVKYYLKNSPSVGKQARATMLATQRARVNAAIHAGADLAKFLSPTQARALAT